MKRAQPLVLLALANLCALSCEQPHVYTVDVLIVGSELAVTGRSVRIGDTDMPPFQVRNGVGDSFVELCTSSHDRFLHATFPIVVTGDQGVVSTATLRPLACALGDPPGPREMDHLYLQDDGVLLTDLTAGDPRVWATCSTLDGGPSCPNGDDF